MEALRHMTSSMMAVMLCCAMLCYATLCHGSQHVLQLGSSTITCSRRLGAAAAAKRIA